MTGVARRIPRTRDTFRIGPRAWALALALAASIAPGARGELPPQPNEEAPLVVEGTVREVFRSVRATTIDYVFMIEVKSATLRPQAGGEEPRWGDIREPKPGEILFVQAFRRRGDAPRLPGPVGYRSLPAEQSLIRAYLYPSVRGGLQFAYPLGFERLGPAEPGPSDPEASTNADPLPPGIDPDGGRPRRIGVFVAQVRVGNRHGLQITGVAPGGPAARAGLEAGDIILEAEGTPIREVADLNRQVSLAGESVHLTIRDARSEQEQAVEVPLAAPQ